MTIIAASVFTLHAAEPAVAFTVVIMARALQIVSSMFSLGRFVNLMSFPAISAFMTGVGCIHIIMQLEPLLGIASPSSASNALTVLPEQLAKPNWQAATIGTLALLPCLYTLNRLNRIGLRRCGR